MPRTKPATTEAVSPETVTLEPPRARESPQPPLAGEQSRPGEPETRATLPDPRALITVPLGDARNSPKLNLLRSHQYNQIQIRPDEPLADKHQAMLREAGWKDRTEQEGIWTKQLPKGEDEHGNKREKWRDAADAERLFKQIANDIRGDRGLGPVLGL